ncbi:LysR family transcriptional regulator [Flaviaesturariibacter amylovorans]|uniref:LysR family transcriptional regulator n=1 Tax=Flaviaesturariibacter amylovorans TaxID=1084520 RepID=A0ABP8G4Z7_9BACT
MELQQIRYFIALAEELHFWRTAEKLFITQSALSRQIKALEDELGVQLFERSKRSVKLTRAGSFLYEQWRRLTEDIDRIHRQARSLHEGSFGFIRIGYPGSLSYGYLPELVSGIAGELPELKIELVEPTDTSFEQLLLNYQMDIAFRRDPAHNPALSSELLYEEPFALIVPAGHRLTKEQFTGLHDLRNEKFILSGLHHGTHYVSGLRQLFQDEGFVPDVHIESDFGGVIMGLIARGLGVSVLPGSYAFGAPPDVRFIPLPQRTSLYVTWRRDDHEPAVKRVLEVARATAKKFE